MQKKLFLPILGVLILFLTLVFFNPIRAVSLDECEKEDLAPDKIGECIDLLSNKVSELGEQKKTLSSQIAQFNSQIQLTQLKISDAQATINKLEKEIGVLGFRIDYITESVDTLERLLKERIVATYQQSFVSNLELLVASNDFSDLILRLQYIKHIQENDKKVLASLQETKSNYSNQKEEREVKQAQIEEVKKKLDANVALLATQKSEKEAFLKVTKNDEAHYQRLLAQALAERKAIAAVFSQAVSRLNSGEGNSINKGGTIALVGNSGAPDCSSGPHLHFTVLQNGSSIDPAGKLKNISPGWNNAPDGTFSFTGDWDWPISNPAITQGYGMTYWAKRGWYNGSIHDGIDMTGGPTIVAPKDGKMILGATTCDNLLVPGISTLKYAAVKHSDDPSIITLYLHIQ